MSWTEIVAVAFSLACVWLAMQRHILNWPAGIIAVSAYFWLFYEIRLYADMALQLVFFVQGIYGWYNWKQGSEDKITPVYLGNPQRLLYAALIIAFAGTGALLLIRFTDASTPYADALAATVSLAANWLMARKKIENWILWISADLIYILLFAYKELYLSSGIYVVFLILSIKGLISWSRESVTEKDLY